MKIQGHDCTQPMPTMRHETLARLLADTAKTISDDDLASLARFKPATVRRLRSDPNILKRVHFIQQGKLRGLVPKALRTLQQLLDSDRDTVRLKAAIEVLDRAGLSIEKPMESHAAFNLTLNLAEPGALKTVTDPRPPHFDEDFSALETLPEDSDAGTF